MCDIFTLVRGKSLRDHHNAFNKYEGGQVEMYRLCDNLRTIARI